MSVIMVEPIASRRGDSNQRLTKGMDDPLQIDLSENYEESKSTQVDITFRSIANGSVRKVPAHSDKIYDEISRVTAGEATIDSIEIPERLETEVVEKKANGMERMVFRWSIHRNLDESVVLTGYHEELTRKLNELFAIQSDATAVSFGSLGRIQLGSSRKSKKFLKLPTELESQICWLNSIALHTEIAEVPDGLGGELGILAPTHLNLVKAFLQITAVPSTAMVHHRITRQMVLEFELEEVVGVRVGRGQLIRTVDSQASISEHKLIWQRSDDWLGFESSDLSSWTSSTLERAKEGLSNSPAEDFEFYDAERGGTKPHLMRWVRFTESTTSRNSMSLCRSLKARNWMPRRFWISEVFVSRESRRATGEFEILRSEASRLQYGLDARSRSEVAARLKVSGNQAILELRSYLPNEGHRLIIAFGEDVSDRPGLLPIKIKFHPNNLEVIVNYLASLHVRCEKES